MFFPNIIITYLYGAPIVLRFYMQMRLFEAHDFPIYQSWFQDPWLQQALGPMDEDWLSYILQDKTGAQFSFLEKEALNCVIGLTWASETHPENIITDIAVRPDLRGHGLGKQALNLLISQQQNGHPWIAYVEQNNSKAAAFFDRLGWQKSMEDMLRFTYYTFTSNR